MPNADVRTVLMVTAAFRRTVLEPLLRTVGPLVTAQARTYTADRASLAVDGAHLPARLEPLAHDVARVRRPLVCCAAVSCCAAPSARPSSPPCR